jgi:nucleotide-binding universal stress UspA family protein
MLRSILVALDGSPWSETATTLALDWAARFEARLFGLGVLDEPSIDRGEPVPMGAFSYKTHRDATKLADAHHRILSFLDVFRARSAAVGLTATVLEDIGDPAQFILREAQRCDVVIMGRESHFRFETQDRPDATLGQVLRTSPRPVVVVPRELPGGRGIMVAYGGGREGARTLQVFESLGLASGEDVAVVTVDADRDRAEATAALAGDFLAAHGTPHQLCPIVSEAPAGTVLLEQLQRRRPALLVIGAHGHHPLRDLFAGSVTRAVLQECPVPVFVGA